MANGLSEIRGNVHAPRGTKKGPSLLPYAHSVFHNLRKHGGRFGVGMDCTARNRLGWLCARTGHALQRKKSLPEKTRNKDRRILMGIVNKIPLWCSKEPVGQTERCVNDIMKRIPAPFVPPRLATLRLTVAVVMRT